MNQGQTIFTQLISFLPKYEFDKCIKRYNGNYKVKEFTCREQFLVMSFAQLTYRESLRDIEACLGVVSNKLYHSGINSKVNKSTLAYANEKRDWRIYADFAQLLIQQARILYQDDHDFPLDIENLVYALDSSTIDLCLSLFPWAKFRKNKGAIKLHTLLDLRGSIPTFIEITEGLVQDMNILDHLILEPGAFYVLDRGYIDFKRLYAIEQASAYFVTRAKINFSFKRIYSHPIDKATGLRCDQTIQMVDRGSKKDYPKKLRRVKYYDGEKNDSWVFLTNNFQISALQVAQLYKQRWKIELFFKWIKQHLRIKSFFGTTRNAVYLQIWIAISIYLLVVIMKKKMKLEQSLYTILQILSISLFEKMPIKQAFTKEDYKELFTDNKNQLILFE
jgi:uncharacterized protein DUF4372/DDE family transposase